MAVVGLCQTQWSMSRNAAVLVGSLATFTCHTNNTRTCFIYRANASAPDVDKTDICRKKRDKKFIDRCNVTMQHTKGTVTLTISDVRLNDAGFYGCGDCFHLPVPEATAHLLVLGNKLKCHMLMFIRYDLVQN